MNAIIVDDEPDGVRTLQTMLAQHCPQIHVVATCGDAFTAQEMIGLQQPDLLFLDIQMPGKTGFDLLSETENRNFQIIFVTAHNEYMLKALQFSAADYLLKPVDEDRLVEAVTRVEKKIKNESTAEQRTALLHNITRASSPSEMRLCIPTQKGFLIVKLEEIIYCEAERSYVVFHLTNKKSVTVSKPLFDYDNILQATSFLRIHKSFLINLLHVKEYQRGEGGVVVMSNGAEIEVSRRKKDQFLAKIKEVFKH
ncbi:MAG: LytR/AlgR family response regulator transcription factor [Agriterribacter sp.]